MAMSKSDMELRFFRDEDLHEYLFQNFNYEIFKKLYDFFSDPKEREILKQIYDNDLKVVVLEEYISGKHASEPIKDPRYGLISDPKLKLEFVNDLKLLSSAMRHKLMDMLNGKNLFLHMTKPED